MKGTAPLKPLGIFCQQTPPPHGKQLIMLIIGKRPAPKSVKAGHYFQGRQGTSLWNLFKRYGIMQIPEGEYEDDFLLDHGYGIMDIVKTPSEAGIETTDQEYRQGLQRIRQAIETHNPRIMMFVYKPPLCQLLKVNFNLEKEPDYGFNIGLDQYFGARVFLFPLPGTPATKEEIVRAMSELRDAIHG
jgi:G:T/U-mismatch repair DNA glycosylase